MQACPVTVNKEGVARKPSATLINKVLSEARFNPKIPGPLRVVCDHSDPHYCELRAMELIQEAKNIREHQPKWFRNNVRYHECLNTTIQLMALARIV